MISPTGNIYCDFCGRERAECGPVTANNGMGGRCHICADCALRSIASRLAEIGKITLQRPGAERLPLQGRRELRDASPFLPDMLANNAPVI